MIKKIILLLMLGGGGTALAQSNVVGTVFAPTNTIATNAAGTNTVATNAPAAQAQTQITSDSADFDLNTRHAIYRGHVKVENPQVKMSCGWLSVDLPAAGAHVSHVVAETNVVIDFTDKKGQTYHVTAVKAVYAYKVSGAVTNETVTFTGHPRVETAQSIIESEPMVWDRTHNKFLFTDPKMISREGMKSAAGTNHPALMNMNLY